ncbi:hypothetical protein LENED_006327 [Lentinula edodes]|uniref:Uncharacterized protein n=1 Tax=Lentinula edodes TaxID=5353 RepID=A0A1Q3EBL6_LENED|nr:hypothetical protein LENED_006327 [Lentinula edodes]
MAGLKSPGVFDSFYLIFRLFHFINNSFVPSSNRISDPFLLLSYTSIDFARNASFVSFFVKRFGSVVSEKIKNVCKMQD